MMGKYINCVTGEVVVSYCSHVELGLNPTFFLSFHFPVGLKQNANKYNWEKSYLTTR